MWQQLTTSTTTTSRQFHQRFSRSFFVRMLFWQLFLYTYVEKKLPKRHSYEKSAQKMLMKLTLGQQQLALNSFSQLNDEKNLNESVNK